MLKFREEIDLSVILLGIEARKSIWSVNFDFEINVDSGEDRCQDEIRAKKNSFLF